MINNLDPSNLDESLSIIKDKERNFGELKENLERLGVSSIFILPLTIRLSILYASRIVYETAYDVYDTNEEIFDYIKTTMMEIILMGVRIIMQGICSVSGDCKIIYS